MYLPYKLLNTESRTLVSAPAQCVEALALTLTPGPSTSSQDRLARLQNALVPPGTQQGRAHLGGVGHYWQVRLMRN